MTERTVELGKMRVRGLEIDFTPSPLEPMRVPRGDTVRLVVAYRFEEVSEEREQFRIRMRATIDGHEEEAKAGVDDRPAVHDEVWGALVLSKRMTTRGKLAVPVAILADVTSAPWRGGEPVTEHFEWKGEAVLDVV